MRALCPQHGLMFWLRADDPPIVIKDQHPYNHKGLGQDGFFYIKHYPIIIVINMRDSDATPALRATAFFTSPSFAENCLKKDKPPKQ